MTMIAEELSQQQAGSIDTDAAKASSKQGLMRYDARAKVTGAAKYAVEFVPPADPAYAYMVQSTIPRGRITSIDEGAAMKSSGVLAVMTPFNAPKLPAAQLRGGISRCCKMRTCFTKGNRLRSWWRARCRRRRRLRRCCGFTTSRRRRSWISGSAWVRRDLLSRRMGACNGDARRPGGGDGKGFGEG